MAVELPDFNLPNTTSLGSFVSIDGTINRIRAAGDKLELSSAVAKAKGEQGFAKGFAHSLAMLGESSLRSIEKHTANDYALGLSKLIQVMPANDLADPEKFKNLKEELKHTISEKYGGLSYSVRDDIEDIDHQADMHIATRSISKLGSHTISSALKAYANAGQNMMLFNDDQMQKYLSSLNESTANVLGDNDTMILDLNARKQAYLRKSEREGLYSATSDASLEDLKKLTNDYSKVLLMAPHPELFKPANMSIDIHKMTAEKPYICIYN